MEYNSNEKLLETWSGARFDKRKLDTVDKIAQFFLFKFTKIKSMQQAQKMTLWSYIFKSKQKTCKNQEELSKFYIDIF